MGTPHEPRRPHRSRTQFLVIDRFPELVGDGVLLRFAADLRELRSRAGEPPYRELARRAHYSAGTLSDAAGGRKLPTLTVALAYVRACDGDTAEWEQRWHEVAAELAADEGDQNGEPPPGDDGQAPYVGLRFFRPEDAGFFFGRGMLSDAQVLVGPMTTAELRDAIVQPAVQAGCTVEGALVTELIAQAQGQAGVLPLLSHVLLETWRRRRGYTLTLTGYHSAGGVHGALARTAEHHYSALTPDQQQVAKQLFLRLTALGDGTDDTKRRVSRTEFDTGGPDTDTVLAVLAAARLITVGDSGVEIDIHQAVRMWDVTSGRLLLSSPGNAHYQEDLLTGALAFSPDGRTLATTSGPDQVVLWDLASMTPRASLPSTDVGERPLAFSPDSTRLVIPTKDGDIAVWDVATREVVDEYGHVGTTNDVAFDPTSGGIIFATYEEGLKIWLPGENAIGVPGGENVGSFQLASNGTITSPTPRGLRIWKMAKLPYPDYPGPSDIAFDATGRRMLGVGITGVNGGALPVKSWDADDHMVYSTPFPAEKFTYTIGGKLSPDLRLSTLTVGPRTIVLYDLVERRRAAELTAASGTLSVLRFSADSRFLAASYLPDNTDGTEPNHTLIWDLETRQPIATLPAAGLTSLAFSPNGRQLALAGMTTVSVWDIATRTKLRDLPVTGTRVFDLAYSPDGRLLATGTQDGTVRLWDTSHYGHVTDLRGHTGSVNVLAFNPNTTLLATAGADNDVILWDLATHTRWATLTGQTGSIDEATWNRDGTALATTSSDGITTWSTNTGRTVQQLCRTLATDFPQDAQPPPAGCSR